jgi:hypothetical protein
LFLRNTREIWLFNCVFEGKNTKKPLPPTLNFFNFWRYDSYYIVHVKCQTSLTLINLTMTIKYQCYDHVFWVFLSMSKPIFLKLQYTTYFFCYIFILYSSFLFEAHTTSSLWFVTSFAGTAYLLLCESCKWYKKDVPFSLLELQNERVSLSLSLSPPPGHTCWHFINNEEYWWIWQEH